jgi:hypothetical protein
VPIPHDERLQRFAQRAFDEVPGLRELAQPAITAWFRPAQST